MSTLPLPDPALHDVGLDDGGQRGAKQVRLLEHVGLAPSTDLLEIGCGLGRLAYELATYFDGGSYTGFDISAEAIDWLNAEYAPRLPGFRFDLLDVASARYRPDGEQPAASVRFPWRRKAKRPFCVRIPSVKGKSPVIKDESDCGVVPHCETTSSKTSPSRASSTRKGEVSRR